jgi:phosphoglycolate phosphatase
MPVVKTVIFDFDGTIADSFTTLLGIFEEITGRKEKLTPAEIKDLRGEPLSQVMKYLDIKRWQIPRLLIKARRAIAIKITGIKPFEGLPQVLKRMSDSGYQMFIVSTNSSDNISKFLKQHQLDSYFNGVYGNTGLRGKPAALRKLLKRENIALGSCIYIGDEVRDVEAGQAVSVPQIAVSWGFNYPAALKQARPTYLATTPGDILKILTSRQ